MLQHNVANTIQLIENMGGIGFANVDINLMLKHMVVGYSVSWS